MANKLTRGLIPSTRLEIERTGVIDFTHLKPEDVARDVPRGKIEVDWQSLLFIKNSRPADTIFLTAREGFFRTPMTPKELVSQAIDSTDKTWHDHHTNVQLLQLSEPAPVVSGNLQLLVTEQPMRKNQTSWVGVQFIERVNEVSPKKVRVQLENGMEMIFRDTVTRLRKKMTEANRIKHHLIKEHQSSLQHFAPDKYPESAADGFDIREDRVKRSVALLSDCMVALNQPQSPQNLRTVIVSVLRGNRGTFHFEDEQY